MSDTDAGGIRALDAIVRPQYIGNMVASALAFTMAFNLMKVEFPNAAVFSLAGWGLGMMILAYPIILAYWGDGNE